MAYAKLGALVERINSTATSGGTLNLANNSESYQRFTGTTTHTAVLPDATTCPVGLKFAVMNRSTGAVTVQTFGGGALATIAAGEQRTFRLANNSSPAGSWDATVESGSGAASLSSAEKLGALSALASSLYQDEETDATTIKVNPEEIGADYWTTKSSLPAVTGYASGFSLDGFGYAVGGWNGSVATDALRRFSKDSNFWLSRQVMTNARFDNGCFEIGEFGFSVAGQISVGVLSAVNEKYNPSTNVWSSRASISTATDELAGFSLSDYGYVAGGSTGVEIATVQIFDDNANAWYQRTSTPLARRGFMPAVLDKKAYIAGGYNSGYQSNAYGYNEVSNSWGIIASLTLSKAYGCTGAVGGEIVCAGGNTGSLSANVQKYIADANTWKNSASLATATSGLGHRMLELGGGHIYGGDTGSFTASTQEYVNFSFFQVPITKKSIAVPTSIFAAAAINAVVTSLPVRLRTDGDNWKYFEANKDGVLKLGETLSAKFNKSLMPYWMGGTPDNATAQTTMQFYDDRSNTWTSRQSASATRWLHGSFSVDGKGYVFEGQGTGGANRHSSEKYDELLNSWVTAATTTATYTPIGCHGYELEGYGYSVGGSTSTANFNSGITDHYRYNPSLDSWLIKAVLTAARAGGYSGSQNGYGFVAAGHAIGGANQTTNYRYFPSTDTWSTGGALTSARAEGCGGASLGGFGYAVGGSGGPANAEKFNSGTNSWSNTAALSVNHGAASTVAPSANGYVYAAGNGFASATSEKYNPDSNVWASIASPSTNLAYGSSGASAGSYRNYELQVGLPTYLAALGSEQWVTRTSMISASSNGGTCGHFEGRTFNTLSSDGTTTQYYTPATDSWVRWTNNPVATSSGGMSGFNLGGLIYSIDRLVPMYAANFSTGAWVARAAEIYDRFRVLQPHGTALNGYGYNYGGDLANSGTFLNHADRYDSSSNSWLNRASTASTASRYCGGFNLNSAWYIKFGDNGAYTNAFESYNDAGNSWSSKANYPITGGQQASMISNGYGLSIGGYNGSYVSNTYRYSDSLNSWITMPNDFRGGYINGCTDSNNGLSFGGDTGSVISSNYQLVPAIKNIVLGAALRVGE